METIKHEGRDGLKGNRKDFLVSFVFEKLRLYRFYGKSAVNQKSCR